MNGVQRVIKVCAVALAAFLIFLIVSCIVAGVSFLGMMVWGDEIGWNSSEGSWTVDEYALEEVRELDINVKATNLKFQVVEEGEAVRVETNNEYIDTWVNGNKLSVVERSHGVFGWGGKGDLVVYVRDDVVFDEAKLEVGAGALEMEKLEAKRVRLNLGAGKTHIDKLKVSEQADIDGGAGLFELWNGEIKDLDLDLGVGKAELLVKLTGNNRIETGVGKTDLILLGEKDDYRITVDKGIGNVSVDAVSVDDGAVIGEGQDLVEVSAGVGAVDIRLPGEE